MLYEFHIRPTLQSGVHAPILFCMLRFAGFEAH
jgi:hypothetical protein